MGIAQNPTPPAPKYGKIETTNTMTIRNRHDMVLVTALSFNRPVHWVDVQRQLAANGFGDVPKGTVTSVLSTASKHHGTLVKLPRQFRQVVHIDGEEIPVAMYCRPNLADKLLSDDGAEPVQLSIPVPGEMVEQVKPLPVDPDIVDAIVEKVVERLAVNRDIIWHPGKSCAIDPDMIELTGLE